MSESATAHVTVERPPDLGGLLARLTVEMDGVRVGRLRRGDSVSLEVPPGRHVFRVRQAWFGSEPLTVDLRAGQRAVLAGSTEERALRFSGTFRHPESALDLKLISVQ